MYIFISTENERKRCCIDRESLSIYRSRKVRESITLFALFSLSLILYICMYVCMYRERCGERDMGIYIYLYIQIDRDRSREREREMLNTRGITVSLYVCVLTGRLQLSLSLFLSLSLHFPLSRSICNIYIQRDRNVQCIGNLFRSLSLYIHIYLDVEQKRNLYLSVDVEYRGTLYL